jgi:hypothetical protein
MPERLELVDRFPLTNVGKMSKRDLREDIARKLEAERTLSAAEGDRPCGSASSAVDRPDSISRC